MLCYDAELKLNCNFWGWGSKTKGFCEQHNFWNLVSHGCVSCLDQPVSNIAWTPAEASPLLGALSMTVPHVFPISINTAEAVLQPFSWGEGHSFASFPFTQTPVSIKPVGILCECLLWIFFLLVWFGWHSLKISKLFLCEWKPKILAWENVIY